MTPTMVRASSFTRIVWPSTSARPPKERFQTPSLSMATLGAPSSSSPGRNVRPSAGETPRVSKNPGVAWTASTRSV